MTGANMMDATTLVLEGAPLAASSHGWANFFHLCAEHKKKKGRAPVPGL
jgi:hypothetical protein